VSGAAAPPVPQVRTDVVVGGTAPGADAYRAAVNRLVAAAAGLLPLSVLAAGTGQLALADVPTSPHTAAAATVVSSCAEVVAGMSLSEQVGQLLMVAQSSTQPSRSGRETIDDLHVGSVVLLGNSKAGRSRTRKLVDQLRSGAGKTDGVQVLVAVDQEGGLVQRLQGSGFTRIPAARDQAAWSDSKLRSKAEVWSTELAKAGIDANLAPVADVVPSKIGNANKPIGALRRGYGPNPATVAHKTAAVVDGMHAGRTATAAKHFPGLGRVKGNTDYVAKVYDRTTTRHDPLLAGFAAEIEHGTDMVMVSSATYTKIDSKHPATYSSTVMKKMLRSDLGFTGVIVSDSLSGEALSNVKVRDRGVRFISAGGDLALSGSFAQLRSIRAGIVDKAEDSAAFRKQVQASATRVVAMKARQGLSSCSVG
jgi:beta-N-acetylhexosaminidase